MPSHREHPRAYRPSRCHANPGEDIQTLHTLHGQHQREVYGDAHGSLRDYHAHLHPPAPQPKYRSPSAHMRACARTLRRKALGRHQLLGAPRAPAPQGAASNPKRLPALVDVRLTPSDAGPADDVALTVPASATPGVWGRPAAKTGAREPVSCWASRRSNS